jgi:hypothetical protein
MVNRAVLAVGGSLIRQSYEVTGINIRPIKRLSPENLK